MTYFGFLLRFVFVPILILLAVTIWDERRGKDTPAFQKKLVWRIIFVHVALALVYTTPWDNYLVASGVWSYNPKLVSGIVFGWVPLEEYTFFIVETVLSGLWWWFLARRIGRSSSRVAAYRDHDIVQSFRPSRRLVYVSTCLLSTAWLFFTFQFFFGPESWNYLGIIFLWALLAILPQLLFGADILWHYRKLVFWTVFPPALYLSLTDIIALKATTWSISPSQTLGINFFGILPLEELTFFFITNTLIGFGLTLMLSDISQQRLGDWRSAVRKLKIRTYARRLIHRG
jgi:lycopene cyclase domain-containing protein